MIKIVLTSFFCVSLFFNSQAQQADLVIKKVDWSSCYNAIEKTDDPCIKISIKNQGKADADSSEIYIWNASITVEQAEKIGVSKKEMEAIKKTIKDDPEITGEIYQELYQAIPPIKKGKTVIITLPLNIYSDFDPILGLGITLNPKNSIEESDITNNTKYICNWD